MDGKTPAGFTNQLGNLHWCNRRRNRTVCLSATVVVQKLV
jgi:hypothetical protein